MFSSWILLIICSIPKIRIKTTTILFHHLYVVNPLRKKSNENSFKKYILVDAWCSYSQTQDTYYQCANVGSLILSVYFRIIYNLYLLHSSQMGLQICFPKSWKYVCILLIKTFLARYLFCCDHKQRHNKMLFLYCKLHDYYYTQKTQTR